MVPGASAEFRCKLRSDCRASGASAAAWLCGCLMTSPAERGRALGKVFKWAEQGPVGNNTDGASGLGSMRVAGGSGIAH